MRMYAFQKVLVSSNNLRHGGGIHALGHAVLLSFCNFLKQIAVHAGFLWSKLAAEIELFLYLRFGSVLDGVHLSEELVLHVHHLLLLPLVLNLLLLVLKFRLLHPLSHVRLVGSVLTFLLHALGIHLGVKHVSYLLVLLPFLHASIDVVEAGFLILLDALLNILAVLFLLKFFIFVVNKVRHLVHDCRNPCAPLSHCCIPLPLLLLLHFDILLNFPGFCLLSPLFLLGPSLLLLLVISNHLHCSRSFLLFLDGFLLLGGVELFLDFPGLNYALMN